jgi:hypothetical protein
VQENSPQLIAFHTRGFGTHIEAARAQYRNQSGGIDGTSHWQADKRAR